MSAYGAEFDRLVERWRTIEDVHDEQHPDRGECGGVGACSMMYAANDLQRKMMEQLEAWRAPCECEGN